ncbi:T9SS type A sorting domain-containing protein, partial [bacterium]|nr:T9SS type A sorting domain-containing protein [bacterium]
SARGTASTVRGGAGGPPGRPPFPSTLNPRAPAGAASTTILGDTDLAISITGDNVTLDGFTVSNPNGHYALVATDRSGLTLRNNHFYDVGTGTTTGYVHCVTVICSNTDIDGFTIEDNEFSAIHADLNSSASALSFGWSTGTFDITNALIQRNHIHDVRSNTSDWPVGHGAYGILLNHSGNLDGETVAPQILDNTIEDLEGLWAHAIGLEGNTPGAVVTGNDISNLVDYKTPTDAVGVMVEDNAGWGDLNIHDNSFTALGYGVFTTMTDRTMVDATSNWWGSATGPYHPTLNPSGAGVLVGDNILFDPWTGLADLSILPGLSGPINCSQSSVLNFHYAPGDMTPALRGYEVTVACDAGLTFDGTDISDLGALSDIGMQSFYVTDNGDDSFTICAALLGPTSGLTLEDDLFSIEFHGTATGLQNVNILSYKLRDLDNGEFFATLHDAVIEVDCLGPDAPVLAAEPIYTQGTENTLDWSDESASGATLYYAECAEDAAFSVNLQDSGWIALLTHTFSGLSDNTEYFYRVKAKDALDNESAWSNVESSTQDDNLPVSEAGPLDAYQTSLTFDVPFVASDLTSGVAYVELYYQLNGGAWNPLGGTYTVSPISFTAGGDGSYCFFTVATDNVGNIELNPPSGDVCTIVDTTVPAGTFVINNDDVYTASTSVTLNNAITDDNGPLEMQFSNDNATWSGWVVYAPTYPWSLDLPDGTKTVYAQFKDDAGLVFSPTDDIILDTAPPGAADGLSGLAGHEKTILDWTDPGDGDLALIEVWRGPWHDGSNVSAYPEYDDLPGSTIPTRPANRTAADASVEWTLAGTALPGDEGFTDNFIPRGIYYYELFAQDMAGNYGPPLDENTQVMNYWLGDVRPSGYDGYVDVADITALGTSFGTVDGDGAYDNEIDVGPTDDWSRLGIPLTDNFVDFEDLMIFAMNYNIVAPRPVLDGALDYAMLTWYQVDEVTWALGLVKPCSNLKAIVLRDELPDGISVVLERSAILQHQGGVPIFLQNVARNGLDVSMAVMGTDAILQGEGELFRVNFSAPCELPEISLEVRGVGNLPLDFELEATEIPALPTVYAMARNFPNPFNPKTSIRFDLPEAQDVKLVVYDTMGRRIVTLLNESMQPGFHSVDWMGKDDRGNAVASGIYFYRIEAGPLSQTERMLLLK